VKADGPRPVTLDVNILVAAVVGGPGVYSSWPSPPPLRGNLAANCLGIVNDAQEFRLVLSDHVLRHTGRVLRRIGWEARPIADYLAVLQAIVRHGGGTVIQPQVIVTDCEDNEDNRVLELAAASRSVLIVSEDQHLLALSPWRGVPVLRAAEFASRVDVRRRARRPG
jgi:predicted nucleic acid-binding protein